MNETPIGRFFGVVTRPRTWLNLVFQVVSFPLGLFYFVFLVVGLSVGVGLVIVWVGIPILLVVAGAWWLFGSFERVQARAMLGADVPPAPRSWETATGVWGKLKAHFGNAATWKDLLYLLAKLVFGVVSFSLVVTLAATVGWLALMPVAWVWHIHVITWGAGHFWAPPLWLAILAVPAAVLMFFASLHVINGWGWVCARWAELLLGGPAAAVPAAAPRPAPLVSTAPGPVAAGMPAAPAPQAPPTPLAPPAPPAPPIPPPPPVPVPPPVSDAPAPGTPEQAAADATESPAATGATTATPTGSLPPQGPPDASPAPPVDATRRDTQATD